MSEIGKTIRNSPWTMCGFRFRNLLRKIENSSLEVCYALRTLL